MGFYNLDALEGENIKSETLELYSLQQSDPILRISLERRDTENDWDKKVNDFYSKVNSYK